MRKSGVIFLIFSLALPLAAICADLKPKSAATDTVLIEADTLEANTARGIATFKGSVRALKDEIDLRANTATLQFDQKTRKVTSLIAEGSVMVVWGDRQAVCDRAVYRIQDRTLELQGNVTITRGSESISGHKVTVDLTRNTQNVEGGPGRVRVRVQAGEQSGIMQWKR